MKKIAIYASHYKSEQQEFYSHLLDKLLISKFEVILHNNLISTIPNYNFSKVSFFNKNEELINCDLVISCGGDGTLLRVANFIGRMNIPVIGINIGRLGFLSCVATNEIDTLIENIKENKYSIEERSIIELADINTSFKENNFGLNEIAVHKKNSASFLTIHTYINGQPLSSFWADGLIIATPTGSTAYSLSVGGPIISPETNVFIITPIAPHTLTVRPIIVPDTSLIELKIESRDCEYNVSIDSNCNTFNNSNVLKVKKSEHKLHYMKLENYNFFENLKNKLMWGSDLRN